MNDASLPEQDVNIDKNYSIQLLNPAASLVLLTEFFAERDIELQFLFFQLLQQNLGIARVKIKGEKFLIQSSILNLKRQTWVLGIEQVEKDAGTN